jgi:dTDP-4-amino-4,6-dideoxygalactose transaminase
MIPITKPWIDEAEEAAALRPLRSGWVAQGPEVEAFEAELAAFVGARHACAVSNCTVALHLALAALGVGPGDEVVTVSHSFVATANAARYVGAVPVLVDVDAETLNADPEAVRAAIGPRTRAILVAHQIGMPCDLDALCAIAEAASVPLIEDAACAIGSEWRPAGASDWARIGRPRGTVATFSFHPRKLLTTGDGGMLTTDDPRLDAAFRLARNHGMERTPFGIDVRELGYNYRMTDIQAAVGRAQLAKVPAMIARRREQAARYAELLAGVDGVRAPSEPEWARSNWQSYAVHLETPRGRDASEHQRAVIAAMAYAGVATQAGIMNAHQTAAYERVPWRAGPGGLARSEAARDQRMLLPLFHQLGDDEQGRIVEALARAVRA